MPALALLAERSVVPVDVRGELGRLPGAVEAALYFVCSEALANAAKHAAATRVTIAVQRKRTGSPSRSSTTEAAEPTQLEARGFAVSPTVSRPSAAGSGWRASPAGARASPPTYRLRSSERACRGR